MINQFLHSGQMPRLTLITNQLNKITLKDLQLEHNENDMVMMLILFFYDNYQ